MPIRPEHRWLYPFDWKQLSAVIRFDRAKGRCECCGRPHRAVIRHLRDGRWWDDAGAIWRDGRGRPAARIPNVSLDDKSIRATRVVLATAHLDHDPTNNRGRNLKALCQRCHMIHDRPEHLRRRSITYLMRRARGDLFLGPYQAL